VMNDGDHHENESGNENVHERGNGILKLSERVVLLGSILSGSKQVEVLQVVLWQRSWEFCELIHIQYRNRDCVVVN
jgi:hypothetical protein